MTSKAAPILLQSSSLVLFMARAKYLPNYAFIGDAESIARVLIDPERRFLKHYQLPSLHLLAGSTFYMMSKQERKQFFEERRDAHREGESSVVAPWSPRDLTTLAERLDL